MNYNELNIKKATFEDKYEIAKTIAYGYKKDFEALTKNMEKIANAFKNGIKYEKFWIAEYKGKIIAAAACSDYLSRAFEPNKKECISNFGFFLGYISYYAFKKEFAKPLKYDNKTGYIEFVCVLEEFRGKGIAKAIIKEIINNNINYNEFILDVMDSNIYAIKAYKNIGFIEFDRLLISKSKSKEKIYMKYKK